MSSLNLDHPLEIDEILPVIGPFGRFQFVLELLFCIMELPNGLLIMMPYFSHHNPPWRCVTNSTICHLNGTYSSGQNDYKARCSMPRSHWEFTRPKQHSVVTQFDLYCEKEGLIILSTSLVFVFWAIGGACLGWVTDRFGRKITVLGSSAAVIFFGFISAFAPNFAFYTAMRVMLGFFVPAAFAHKIVFACEFFGPNRRTFATIPIGITFGISACFLGLFAYYTDGWKMLTIVSTAPFFATVACYWFIPESIRWLRVRGRKDEVKAILKRIATFNNKIFPEIQIAEFEEDNTLGIGHVLDLFRPKKIAIRSLIHGYAWIVCGLVFYGVSFAAGDLGGMQYRDFILASLVDLAGTIVCIDILKRFGRKKPIVLSFLIGGIACIGVSLVPARDANNKRNSLTAFRVFLGMVGKFCISICFSGVYLWSTETYPTVARGIGMGYLQIAARIGSALAPWVATGLKTVHPVLPFALMGGSAFICSFLLLLVPETADKCTFETRKDQLAAEDKPKNKNENIEKVRLGESITLDDKTAI